jgi:hypothetical protein
MDPVGLETDIYDTEVQCITPTSQDIPINFENKYC